MSHLNKAGIPGLQAGVNAIVDQPDIGFFEGWPTCIEAKAWEPHLVTSELNQEEKTALWQHLAKHHPDVALSFQTIAADSLVQEILEEFGGSFIVPADKVPESLKLRIKPTRT